MLADKKELEFINEENNKLIIEQIKKRIKKLTPEEFERSKRYLESQGIKLIEIID
jgi:outer membrane lipopolysaccharide assembly protein LptE/RlpB